jgi:Tol biopolymer transport system component
VTSARRPVLSGAVLVAVLGVARPGPAGAGDRSDPTSPSWSPEGSEIAFAYGSFPRFRIATAPSAGGGSLRTISSMTTDDGCCDPLLRAAGGRILFVADFGLRSVRASGGKPTRLFSGTPWFILSPNRETVALTDGCGCGHAPDAVALLNVTGGKRRVVPRPARASDEIDGFSPDGTELVFTRFASLSTGRAETTLMAVSVRGGAPVPLASSGLVGAASVPAGATRVQWSSDGRWVAFVRGLKLETTSAAGGAVHVLATHFGADAFSWSPDSRLVAYDCCSNRPVQNLITVDPRGTHRTVLWTNPSLHWLSEDSLDRPQWSPDGLRLEFSARAGPGSPIHVWTVEAGGHGLRRIA